MSQRRTVAITFNDRGVVLFVYEGVTYDIRGWARALVKIHQASPFAMEQKAGITYYRFSGVVSGKTRSLPVVLQIMAAHGWVVGASL